MSTFGNMRWLSALLLLVCSHMWGQQPSHVVIGATELADVDVYDMIQDEDLNLLIATDRGLYVYDGHRFRLAPLPLEMRGKSVFYLKKNRDGIVFCTNLNNQIYRWNGAALELYVELAEELAWSGMNYAFVDNEMVITARKFLKYSPSEGMQVIANEKFNTNLVSAPNGTVWLRNVSTRELTKYQDGRLEVVSDYPSARVISADPELVLFDQQNQTLLTPGQIRTQKIEGKIRTVYALPGNGYWAALSTTGLQVFNPKLEPHYNGHRIFDEYFISSAFVDHEGSIILGTFGNGLLWIRNPEMLTLPEFANRESVSALSPYIDDEILIATFSGDLLRMDSRFNRVPVDKHSTRVTSIQHIPDTDLFIQCLDQIREPLLSGPSIENDTILEMSATFDVAVVNDSTLGLATRNGYYLMPIDNNGIPTGTSVRNRSMTIARSSSGEVYVGTVKGLILVEPSGSTTELKWNGQRLIVRDMIITPENELILATNSSGVLFFKDGEFTRQIAEKEGLTSAEVKKIQPINDELFVSTAQAFYKVSLSTNKVETIGLGEGLLSPVVRDFIVQGDVIWLHTQRGLQQITLDALKSRVPEPSVRIAEIKVNGQLVGSDGLELDYDQNKIEFLLDCRAYAHASDVRYKVKLDGLDEDWQIRSYYEHILEFKSLPPGDYTLRVIPVIRGAEGEEVSVRFSIAFPFYQSWWFYTLLVLCAGLVSFLFYRYYARRQLKRAQMVNELNASKLTAIQSQMNPHFIFNSLNSIQDLVLSGETEKSYTYITEFADLVRKTLNYSDKDFIDLDQEVKLIKLYLTLEKLRFKSDFEYELDELSDETIRVPPMLIQPFIENAIAHGLLHKEGLRVLKVRFEVQDHLVCTVEDNGIGREAAKSIRNRQRGNHESFSVNAIQKRFDILSSHFGGDLGFHYEDLVEDGKPSGTRVTLKIPIQRSL